MRSFKNNKFMLLYHFSSQREEKQLEIDSDARTPSSRRCEPREGPRGPDIFQCSWGVGHDLSISIYFTWHDRNPKEREGGKDGIHSRDDEGALPGWAGALRGGGRALSGRSIPIVLQRAPGVCFCFQISISRKKSASWGRELCSLSRSSGHRPPSAPHGMTVGCHRQLGTCEVHDCSHRP